MLEKYFQVNPEDCKHLTLMQFLQYRIELTYSAYVYEFVLQRHTHVYTHMYVTCINQRKTVYHNRQNLLKGLSFKTTRYGSRVVTVSLAFCC